MKHDVPRTVDITESNDVLQRLQQEAMELEKSYKQFQERQISIKTQLPAYVEKTKAAIATSQNTNNNDVKEDGNQLQTNAMLKSDSFDLSHLIPSRRMAESNEGKDVTNYSISTSRDNVSLMTSALSSSRVNEHKQSTAISLANSQLDSALSRFEVVSSDYLTNSSRHHLTKNYDEILLADIETRGHVVGSNVFPSAMYHTPSTRTKHGGTTSLQINSRNQIPVSEINSLTQLPLTETFQPIDSLTQLPLMESIKPINSLTQIPLMETILPMNSLTQLPLSETVQPSYSLTQMPLMETPQPKQSLTQLSSIETSQPIDSLTQIPFTETTQAVDSLTQLPLMDTLQPVNLLTQRLTETNRPIDSLTQLPLTETIACNASLTQFPLEETKNNFATMTPHIPSERVAPTHVARRRDDTSDVKTTTTCDTVTSVTYATSGLGVTRMETSDIPTSSNFNTRNDDFDSKNDIFKSSNFMMKGFQSTRIASGDVPPPDITPEKVITKNNSIIGKVLHRHSTPETDQHSEVESIQNVSGKPQASSIGRDNISSDSSNIVSGPFDSEEKVESHGSIQKHEVKTTGGETNMEKTLSEGEVDHVTGKSEGEISHGGVITCKSEGEVFDANPMAQYMEMILARRDEDSKVDEHSNDVQIDIQRSVHEDVPLSEIDEKNENSEPSSEFEW